MPITVKKPANAPKVYIELDHCEFELLRDVKAKMGTLYAIRVLRMKNNRGPLIEAKKFIDDIKVDG